MSMEQWWNGDTREKLKKLREKPVSVNYNAEIQ
jgi:hypothetical protein